MATITTLSEQESAKTGFTHKLTFTYADVAAEATTVAFEVFPKWTTATNMAAGNRVLDCALDVETAFTGGALSALTVVVGDGGDTARFLASSSIFTASYFSGAISKMPYVYTAADTIDMIITATGAACSACTAGKAHLYLAIHQMTRLRNARG